jgi:acetyl esterase/lipase
MESEALLNDDILNLPSPKADVRVAYGNDPNQFADLRLPKRNARGLALAIHGGFWRAKYDLAYMGHLCAALAEKGVATANLEYRRIGNPGGGWPGSFSDIRSAFQFLQQNARKYRFEAQPIVVLGHSAGGQLALCLAAHEPALKAAISLAGVVDLQRTYALHLSNDAVVEFLGGKPTEVADHYREADPMKLTIAARQALICGAEDDVVPPTFSKDYVAAKKMMHENVCLKEIPGAGHFEVVDPRTDVGREVQRIVIDSLL